jgi:hypothetical protein
VLKKGNETLANCERLKILTSDGKMRLTDVADTEQVLPLIRPVHSNVKTGIKLTGDSRLEIRI